MKVSKKGLEERLDKKLGTLVEERFSEMICNIFSEKYNIRIKIVENLKWNNSLGQCWKSKINEKYVALLIEISKETFKDLGNFRYVLAHELAHLKFTSHTLNYMLEIERILKEIELI